jgi:hypothetical protein
MPKYSRSFAPDELDDDEVELDHEGNPITQSNDDDLPPEEKTFKKRYGDLRRYNQKQVDEKNAEIARLQAQLDTAAQGELKFPKSEDEITAWMNKFPDVAGIVKSIAMKEAIEANRKLDERLQDINKREEKSAKEIAQAKLAERHPDFFDDIRNDSEFHEWLETKSQRMQDAMYVNETDWQAASEVIDMYKLENNIKSTKTNDKRRAADYVPTGRDGGRPSGRGEYKFSESQVEAMSTAEYMKYEPEIEAAIHEGKFNYDLSGGAR